ncbi:isopeptide-forming domain-containing fimbrial protein [Paratractidigestivibacter faecalis]|uniref:isopeptide-forming domain-containing fimbrial protein n=1 Tax=Paratractidigestivibacter faecalis TaxID=2292441 RepID=UPI0018E54354|nr:isopeptide-forming domain-containing fimbrial protein [Paratractidigestivibacter faecalis]
MSNRGFTSRFRGLVALLCVLGLTLVPMLAKAAIASSARNAATGTLTVSGTVADAYEAYRLFDAEVADGGSGDKVASDVMWASDSVRDAALLVMREAGMDASGAAAQDAAEWLDADGHMTPSLAMKLARAIRAAGVEPVTIPVGNAAELPAGYWLVVADDGAIGESQAGTAPIFALVGGAPVTVAPKAAIPEVCKHVLEDSDGAWSKAADATVGDDLYWRLAATIPAGLAGYDAYTVEFADAMSAGLDPAKVASSARVYVAAGTSGGFDAVTVAGGSAGAEPADGWTDITSGCDVAVDSTANTFTVRTGDLIAALGGAEKFAAGARVVVVYNAPLRAGANRGIQKGNPNEVYLRYPRSPFSDQGGEGGYTRTPSDRATAYTWELALTKRASDDQAPLSGAVLRVTDDRGRRLAADGSWAEGDVTVTTGADGRVTMGGVDSGVLTVEEVAAPEGYVGFAGARELVLAVEGLDVQQVAAARPTLTVSAAEPLRVDEADAASGAAEATILNSRRPKGPIEWLGGLLPKTNDGSLAAAFMLACAGGLLAAASRLFGRRGNRRDE